MDDQLNCRLLQDPQLPLHVIWDLVCKLPMRDRCALMATCKKALHTFGGLTTRMARLRLTMCEKPRQTRQATKALAKHLLRGDSSHALGILSQFPDATFEKLQLQFIGMHDVPMSASIQHFTAGAGARLRHVTSLELNDFDTPGQVSVPPRSISCSCAGAATIVDAEIVPVIFESATMTLIRCSHSSLLSLMN